MKFLAAALLCLSACTLNAQTTVTLQPTQDNTLYEEPFFGSLSNGAGDGIFAGMTAIGDARRLLLSFDVAGAVPAGATIVSASLTLEVTQAVSAPYVFDLHPVLADWGEGASIAFGQQGGGGSAAPGDATWLHTFYPSTFWATPGGDFLPLISASTTVGGIGDRPVWTSAAMAADVQTWLDSPATNFGWLLKIDDESIFFSARRFASREFPTPSARPTLSITYTAGGPTASATTVGAGCPAVSGAPTVLNPIGLPQLGNLGFALESTGPSDGTPAYLYFADASSTVPIPLGTCNIWLDLTSALNYIGTGLSPFPVQAYAGGSALWPFPVPNVPGLGGFSLSFQVVAIEGGSFVLASNAVDVTVGN